MANFDVAKFKKEMRDVPKSVVAFLVHPVRGIRSVPQFSWPALLTVQAGTAMLSGALLGLVEASFFDFLLGILVFPVSSVVLSFVFALFIYYYFSLIHATFLEFRRLYGILVFANIPYFLFHPGAGFLPPIDLVGFAFSSVLLVIGLVEQFELERKKVVRLVGVLYLVFFLIWATAQFRSSSNGSPHSPESFDELERSLEQ